MPYVPEEAVRRYENNPDITSKDLVGIKNYYGDEASLRTAQRWLLYLVNGVADSSSAEAGIEQEVTEEEIEQVRKLLKNNTDGLTAVAISESIDRSPSTALHIITEMQAQGYNVRVENKRISMPKSMSALPIQDISQAIADSMVVKIAVVSDLHCGSTCAQITHYRSFVDYARKEGFTKFFVPGDLSTGKNIYRGHELDTYAHQSEQQEYLVSEAVRPEPGEDWYILAGNHDFSWVKNCSVDIIWRVCDRSTQLHFLGYDAADVKLTDKHAIRLWHPSGGVTYAASYRLQKGIEQVMVENSLVLQDMVNQTEGTLVKTILCGHLHRDASVHEGGVYALLASCFEGQTNYLAKKPLYPRIAGNLLTFYLNDAGNVSKMLTEHVPFVEIKEDYRNYPVEEFGKADEIEAVFSLDTSN